MDFPANTTNGFHVEELKYFYAKEHKMIGLGNYRSPNLQNIGERGSDLTIAVLSMNRSSLTIRLMESIREHLPDFRGEFLIGDNGSHAEEKEMLRAAMKIMPYACRMVEFDKNYGVAGGRNRLFREVRTDWILSMDNDLYFVADPLDKIQKDLWALGCHFLTMPIRDEGKKGCSLYGGNLYIENLNGVSAGGGSAVIVPDIEMGKEYAPFLCTFLSGCAGVIQKKSFFAQGGFDEGMFVGFEDTEFSLRLYQSGMKVGACGFACVIHDHPKPENHSDIHYEKQRFSRNYLKESAEYFEKKHGFSVWNPMVDNWVEQRISELKLEPSAGRSSSQRRKIALIVDRRGWALDNIAAQIVKNLSDSFDFKTLYLSDFNNLGQLLMLADDCQMLHFLWRPLASYYYRDFTQNYIRRLGMTSGDFYRKYVEGKTISVAVYDHLMLSESETDYHYTPDLFSSPDSLVTKYCVSSRKLLDVYNSDDRILMKPSAVISDGVDTSLFVPAGLERFQSENLQNRTIRIGWAGNSQWVVGDLKGINTILRPAVSALQEAGYNVELITSDRLNRMIPHDEMPGFYNGIDVYVCASSCEGTPNPVLEAMACGVPVVSTDVGLVPELFGDKQKHFILKERSVECMVDTLKALLDSPELFEQLSRENLSQIKPWDWKIMTDHMREYFQC